MAKYYQKAFSESAAPIKPPIGPLTGTQVMKADRAAAVLRAQDIPPQLSRRPICSYGIKGSVAWITPNTAPLTASQSHPKRDEERVFGRYKTVLTPGCFLRLSVVALPSGETSRATGGSPAWEAGGAQGIVRVQVLWQQTDLIFEDGSIKHDLVLPSSGLANASEPTADGGAWPALVHRFLDIRPTSLTSNSTLNNFTKSPIKCRIWLMLIGGCRIVDACIYEVPYGVAPEADDAADNWIAQPATFTLPKAGDYPLQRRSETTPDGDPRGGSWHLQDVANAQGRRLGPCLFDWSAANENTMSVSETEEAGVSNATTAFTGITISQNTSWNANYPGGSMACHARPFGHNDETTTLRGKTGVVPVRVWVFAKTTAGTSTVRVQTSPHSWIDVPITATGFDWAEACGWLECGVGPEDPKPVQVMHKAASSATINTLYVCIHYGTESTLPADPSAG
jgi:hypothetical protein